MDFVETVEPEIIEEDDISLEEKIDEVEEELGSE